VSTRAARWTAVLASAFLAIAISTGCHGSKKTKGSALTTNEALYERGRALIEERKFEESRKILNEIGLREAQSPTLDPLVKLAVADSYFYGAGSSNISDVIEAQSRYTQFLTFYPSSPMSGYAQFQIGMCYFKQSPKPHHDQTYTRKALEEFDKVRQMDPAGRFVAAAGMMKDRCMDKLAMHDYQVGVFYFKRKVWAAAISRFKGLLDEFPRFSASDATYYYLGTSLIRTGNTAEGRIYLEKVRRDYPTSRFASKAAAELRSSGV
jgi:outer membrane protein assembly factor BamD